MLQETTNQLSLSEKASIIKDANKIATAMRGTQSVKNLRGGLKFWLRKNRYEHPEGSMDNAKRWYPDASENLNTRNFRCPSRSFPWSYMHACRTAAHCADLCGSDVTEVRALARKLDKAETRQEVIALFSRRVSEALKGKLD